MASIHFLSEAGSFFQRARFQSFLISSTFLRGQRICSFSAGALLVIHILVSCPKPSSLVLERLFKDQLLQDNINLAFQIVNETQVFFHERVPTKFKPFPMLAY